MKILIPFTIVSLVGAYVVPQVLNYFETVTQAFQSIGF